MADERNIIGLIRREKEEFLNGSVELAPGYFYSQRETLRRIDNYFNSRFESGPMDEDGWPKPFYNIVRKPVQICAKEIDLDTKDILVRSEDGDYITADLMAVELKQWMKDQGFAKDLNRYADLAPQFGHVVIKKVSDRLHTVDIKRLILSDTTAKTLSHTNIVEPHDYTADELRTVAQKHGWDKAKVEEVISVYERMQQPIIQIDERHGYTPEDMLIPGGDPQKMVYTLCIAGGVSLIEEKEANGQKQLVECGVVIEHMAKKEHPYREWKFMEVEGRWLGMGFVEILFDPQVRANEIAYYKAKGLNWTSLHLYQSDDETVSRNLMNDMRDGDIVKVQQGKTILPIAVEERNLAHYNAEEGRWDKNAADLTFSPDVISGEGLPSGTPARSAIISDANVKRFFDRKREDFGIFLRDIITHDIIPLFKSETKAAHMLSVAAKGVDRDRLEEIILNAKMNQHLQKYISEEGRLPSSGEWRRLMLIEQQKLARRPTIDIPMAEGTYDTLNEKVDVVITKENEDTDAKLQGRQVVLQALAANPNIATNPVTRPVFIELAELLGVRHAHIPSVAQGAVAPQMPQMPTGGPQPQPSPLDALMSAQTA